MVQLAFYSHLLERCAGRGARQMHVVLGDRSERSYRCADYMHYFRALLGRFMARVELAGDAAAPPATYPMPCAHCDLCHWRERCEAQREADDHLCLVAGITRVQTAQAAGRRRQHDGAARRAARSMPRCRGCSPRRWSSCARRRAAGSRAAHRRAQGRGAAARCRSAGAASIACRGPTPATCSSTWKAIRSKTAGSSTCSASGYRDRGAAWRFRAFWAHDRAEERMAFEQFIDFVAERRARASRRAHLPLRQLRRDGAQAPGVAARARARWSSTTCCATGALVDLYKVVREGIRISEPSYSIKSVEHFYRAAREGEVQTAGASIVYYERWRETGDAQLLQRHRGLQPRRRASRRSSCATGCSSCARTACRGRRADVATPATRREAASTGRSRPSAAGAVPRAAGRRAAAPTGRMDSRASRAPS